MAGYRAASTGQAVRAVLFDTFGTVVDWRTGISSAVRAFADAHSLTFDAEEFADAWRSRYQPALERVRSGQRPFVSLDTLHRESLDAALHTHGVDPGALPREGLETLARAWHFLPPWPDSVEGIGQIKRGFVVGPLSNGHTALLLDMAKAARLPWDVIIGSDISQAYKPTPDAYRKPAAILGLDPGEVMLAAAHNDDLAGARRAGLATAFVARPAEYGPHQTRDLAPADSWDEAAGSITELAAALQAKSDDR
jgi:2-haloacid dehalogenase